MPSSVLWLLQASIAHIAAGLVSRSSTSSIHTARGSSSDSYDVQEFLRASFAAEGNFSALALHNLESNESAMRALKGNLSAVHDVVGLGGVLMIYMERAGRKEYKRLNQVGIYPTLLSAVDVKTASPDELRLGGLAPTDKHEKCPNGKGSNKVPVLQAISASHRKAILAAKNRRHAWTAIMEDDAVPIDPVSFNKDFREIWSKIPEGTGVVRLNWCPLLSEDKFLLHSYYSHGSMRIVDYQINYRNGAYHTGGCATAYMVHRDYIPSLLKMFPCCEAFDACMDFELYHLPKGCSGDNSTKCWGQKHMVGLDLHDSVPKTHGWTSWSQHGILAQDNRVSKSIRR